MLFVPQGHDGVEAGGFEGRPNAKEQSDADGNQETGGNRPRRHAGGQDVQELEPGCLARSRAESVAILLLLQQEQQIVLPVSLVRKTFVGIRWNSTLIDLTL